MVLLRFLKNMRKINKGLKFIVKRKQPALFNSLVGDGQGKAKYYQGLIDKRFILPRILYLDHKVYYSSDEPESLGEKVISEINNNPHFLELVAKECYRQGEELVNYSKSVNDLNLKSLEDQKLISLFRGFAERSMICMKFLPLPLSIENYLTENLALILNNKHLPDKLFKKYLNSLSSPLKDNDFILEKKELMKIVQKIKREKGWSNLFKEDFISFKNKLKNIPKLKNILEAHLYNFAWLNTSYYLGKPASIHDLYKKLKLTLKSKSDNDLKSLDTSKGSNKEVALIIEKCKLNASEKKIIGLAREYVYLRTYRTDIFHKSGYYIRPLLEEIGKRNGLTQHDTLYLTHNEIISIFKKKVLKKHINSRKRSHAYYWDGNKNHLYFGEKIKTLKNKLRGRFEKFDNKIKEIEGSSTYPGKITGKVKVIHKVEDMKKVIPGDILVTSMTTPQLMPALKIASAFITDEGGILCHAAIISRELKKPCIIGAKIATQVLKDGDLVEVDAERGIVKIIKRNKTTR